MTDETDRTDGTDRTDSTDSTDGTDRTGRTGTDRAAWKIGELAQATGLTVRTLRHYDEIGLLVPSGRTAAGHRTYDPDDVTRLYRIVALRGLGLALEEVGRALAAGGVPPRDLVAEQLARVEGRLVAAQVLRERLRAVLAVLDAEGQPSSADLLDVIERMQMYERYYTQEQLAQLAERRGALGEDAIRSVEQEWPQLTARVQAAMDAGTDPADPEVQALARRWRELVEAFTGDEGIRAAAQRVGDEQGDALREQHEGMPTPQLGEYVQRAWAAAG